MVKKFSKKALQAKAKKNLAIAKKKFVEAEKKVKTYVHKHPERAAAIAAGIGAAIGLAVGAALRKKKK